MRVEGVGWNVKAVYLSIYPSIYPSQEREAINSKSDIRTLGDRGNWCITLS